MSRLRLSRRRRWIRPLLMCNRLQGAEFFRASSPRSRYVVRSETPHSQQQSLTHLRGCQSDRQCGRRKAKIKHRGCPATRTSRLMGTRRWRKDCRPSLIERPACNRMKGQALRRGLRRPRKVKLSESSGGLALSANAKRRDEIAISRDNARAKPLPNDQRSARGTDSPTTLPSRVDDRSPQRRKRTIMVRYVFGDELKLGERWKRRLLASR